MQPLRKATVIGAGVMGAGIAAQFANAGVPVLLLDIVPDGAANRNALAEGAIADRKRDWPSVVAAIAPVRGQIYQLGGSFKLGQISDFLWYGLAAMTVGSAAGGATADASG